MNSESARDKERDEIHYLHHEYIPLTIAEKEAVHDDNESIQMLEENDDQVDSNASNYEKAFTINIIHYYYAIKNLCQVRKKKKPNIPLSLEDLPLLGKTEEINHKIIELETEYERYQQKHRKPSLLWPLLKIFRWRVLKLQTIVIINSTARILLPFFLSKLLDSWDLNEKNQAYKWMGFLFFVMIVSVYAYHFAYFQSNRIALQIKPTLAGFIYKKIISSSYHSSIQIDVGKIVNIVSNELNGFEFYMGNFQYTITSPFVVAGSLIVLWNLVGISCLPGILFLLLNWPAQFVLSQDGRKFMNEKNNVTDLRIKLTNEMIEGIRFFKSYAWDIQFAETISNVREKEVRLLKKIIYRDYFGSHMLTRLTPILGSFIIFVTHGLILGENLTSGKVYSTLIMLNFLRTAVVLYSWQSFKFASELKTTFQRILDLLQTRETRTQDPQTPMNPENSIEFENFSVAWEQNQRSHISSSLDGNASRNNASDKLTLQNVTFSAKLGTCCAIVGKVGSGKSSILTSFFSEAPKTTGELRFSGRIAYVEQESVIFPGTVRSNILFGKPYKKTKYRKIVKACCLLDDFKKFPNGDLSEIGEKGINLSGGQKSRASLARALYADADIYLLDDPLSAVDSKVAKLLFDQVIRGILLKRRKTVLIATHQIHLARAADKIIVVEDGMIKAEGNFNEITSKDSSILKIFETNQPKRNEGSVQSLSRIEPEDDKNVEPIQVQQVSDSSLLDDDEEENLLDSQEKREIIQLISKERNESNRVGLATYRNYLKNAGGCCFLTSCVMTLISVEVSYNLYNWFLRYWTQAVWTPVFSVEILAAVIIGFLFFLILRELFVVNLGVTASKNLHEKALKRVVRAPIQFFDSNPSGRILNRFSTDVGVLDRNLLQFQDEMIDAAFFFGGIFVTLCIIVPLLIPAVVIFVIIVLLLMRALRDTIVQSRGVELLTRSPIYSLFSQTLSSLAAIKVYRQEKRFAFDFIRLLNCNCRALSFCLDMSRILGFYGDIIALIFSCTGIFIAVTRSDMSAASVGLVCSYLLNIAGYLSLAVRSGTSHFMQMASAERIEAYTEIEQEAPLTYPTDLELIKKKESWPSKGEFDFRNVYLRYRASTEYALKGITFAAKSGEKIGCVGRTGAGKTSIIQALFRMVEFDREAALGSKIMIDDIDMTTVGLHTLRKSISIIPQTPFIFTGSIRTNLDLLEKYSEEEIISALKETNLWGYIQTLPDGLNTKLNSGSSLFSVGQKQLVCLARILLQKNKIVVLDEATANIDFETDNFIQKQIMQKFKTCTVFTIAHRLSTVANYDKILVIRSGRVVEFDHPYKLLVKDIGDITITNTDGLFAAMVNSTGTKQAEAIFETAYMNWSVHSEKKEIDEQ